METTKLNKPRRNNRTAGHNFEREVTKEFRELGFHACSTSRLESRSRDNAKVDLCNTDEHLHGRLPYNVQCKTIVGNADYRNFLAEMPKGKEVNVVIHKSTKKTPGGLFKQVGQYAILTKADFYQIVERLVQLETKENARTIS